MNCERKWIERSQWCYKGDRHAQWMHCVYVGSTKFQQLARSSSTEYMEHDGLVLE